ncbi:hypothetical protein FRC19_006730 [Serendipita sp. 401]|nr:hypothetical protein FRC16_007665 [Serendipita sp. 398]KAG8822083.1 hypothetical protein FRC19_006730 [Serendipita sp. 401]KAG9053141.1 hypothetical protein FS842_008621 [Serendipita sp. 407]
MAPFLPISTLFLAAASSAYATGLTKPASKVVVFGDSFSDTGIWESLIWPDYLGIYLKKPVYSFAKAGATCSNSLTPRIWPDVIHNETTTFNTQKSSGSLGYLDPATTVYTLWIGTNDVGSGCLLTGDQKPGVTLVDVTSCAVNFIKSLYASGARNFLFQNMVPLHKSPMYKKDAYLTRYWTIPNNMTELSIFMESEVTTGNALSKLMLQDLAPSLYGAHLGIFDSYGLFDDIITHPKQYLNGTAPLNTTSSTNACPFAPYGTSPLFCTVATGSDADSFVWYDELHPSDQVHRIVARELASVLKGKDNKWVKWLS